MSLDKAMAKAKAAKVTARQWLGETEGQVGISRRGESFALKINLPAEPTVKIPERFDGVDVIVEVVGKIRALNTGGGASTFHVVPHNGRWAVRRDDARRVSSVHSTQREAIPAARKRARKAHGVLIVHARDGSVRDRDSYEVKS